MRRSIWIHIWIITGSFLPDLDLTDRVVPTDVHNWDDLTIFQAPPMGATCAGQKPLGPIVVLWLLFILTRTDNSLGVDAMIPRKLGKWRAFDFFHFFAFKFTYLEKKVNRVKTMPLVNLLWILGGPFTAENWLPLHEKRCHKKQPKEKKNITTTADYWRPFVFAAMSLLTLHKLVQVRLLSQRCHH